AGWAISQSLAPCKKTISTATIKKLISTSLVHCQKTYPWHCVVVVISGNRASLAMSLNCHCQEVVFGLTLVALAIAKLSAVSHGTMAQPSTTVGATNNVLRSVTT